MLKKLFFISIVWAVIILVLSAIPGSSLPRTPLLNIPYLDKWVHAALYFPLALSLTAVFDLSKKLFFRFSAPFLALVIVGVYGGLIELAQDYLFVERAADLIDLVFDLLGGLFGIACYYLFLRSWFKKRV